MKKAQKLFEALVSQTVRTLGVSRDQAEKRMRRLLDSGVLDQYSSPNDPEFQRTVDKYMTTPV